MSYPRLADWGSSKRNLAFSKRTKENSRETSHQTEGWKVGTIVGGWQLGNLGHLDSFFSPRVCKTMHICILYIYMSFVRHRKKTYISCPCHRIFIAQDASAVRLATWTLYPHAARFQFHVDVSRGIGNINFSLPDRHGWNFYTFYSYITCLVGTVSSCLVTSWWWICWWDLSMLKRANKNPAEKLLFISTSHLVGSFQYFLASF